MILTAGIRTNGAGSPVLGNNLMEAYAFAQTPTPDAATLTSFRKWQQMLTYQCACKVGATSVPTANGLYNSLLSLLLPGSFGYGWGSNESSKIIETSSGIHLKTGNSYIRWVDDNGSYVPFNPNNYNKLEKDLGSTTARYKVTSRDQTVQEFDDTGKLQRVIDRNGNTQTYTYDASGFVESISDLNDNSLHWTRRPDGQPLTLRENDPTTGRLTQYEYYASTDPDVPDRLFRVTDPEGNQTDYIYYTDGPLAAIIDPQGLTAAFYEYDIFGRMSAEEIYGEIRREYQYTSLTNNPNTIVRITEIDTVGSETTRRRILHQDRFGNTVKLEELSDADVFFEYRDTLFEYNDPNNAYLPTKRTDPNLTSVEMTYTADGKLKTSTDKEGNVTTYTYAEELESPLSNEKHRHLIREILRPQVTVNGQPVTYNATKFEYDIDGNLEKIIDAKGQETIMDYETDGLIKSITDRRGNKTSFFYEGLPFNGDSRNLVRIEVPKGDIPADGVRNLFFQYDAYDNVTSVKDDLNHEVITEYDLIDRVKKVTDARGAETAHYYLNSLLREIVLPENNGSGGSTRSTLFDYDSANRVDLVERDIDSVSPKQIRAEYLFNSFGELKELKRFIDGDNKTYAFAYDVLGRQTNMTDSLSESAPTAYEPFCVGQASTSARGIRRKLSFNSRCLLRQMEAGNPDTDPLQLASVRERYFWDYDELGRLISRSKSQSRWGSAIWNTDDYAEKDLFEYDELDRLTRFLRAPEGEDSYECLYEYDSEGNVTKVTEPNDRVTEYTYYRDNLLKEVIVKRPSQADRVFTYEYDPAGRLDKITYPAGSDVVALFRDEADLTPTGIGTGFDQNGNLQFLRYQKSNGTLIRRFEWGYDPSNNREMMLDVTPTKAIKWEYGFDWLDRLVSVRRAEAADEASLPATSLQRAYVFDESDNRKFFDDYVNGVTYYYKYRSVDKQIPVYSQEELRQLILNWIDQNLSQFIDDIEDIIQDTIENYTGQTTQELEDYALNDLNGFVEMLEDAAGQTVEEMYGANFQQFNTLTLYSDQIDEILIYGTAAGHRTVGDFTLFESFEHDADGNITKRTLAGTSEETMLEWTDFDRLKKVESSIDGVLQEMRYNVDHLREWKKDKNGNSSVEYAGDIMTKASEPGTGSTAPSISYISGHMIMAAEIDGNFVYHLGDALGTTRDVVDDSGNIIKSFEFTEYGNLMSSTGTGNACKRTRYSTVK